MSAKENGRMCFACGPDNPISLGLKFQLLDDNRVEAYFTPAEIYQGYDGVLHGGIVATLLDEAMAKAMNLQGILAFTAELKLRFKKPAPIAERLKITAEITRNRGRLYLTRAELRDGDGEILCTAEGKFMSE